jgi:hypothetical protein
MVSIWTVKDSEHPVYYLPGREAPKEGRVQLQPSPRK